MAFLAAALPAIADLGAAGSAAAAGTTAAAGAGATAGLAGADAAATGADALGTILNAGAVPSAGELLAASQIPGTTVGSLSNILGSAANTLPTADSLKSLASGNGKDISDLVSAFLGQQKSQQPAQQPLIPPKNTSRGSGINIPPLLTPQMPNPMAIKDISQRVGSNNPQQSLQMQQLLQLLLGSQIDAGRSL